MLDGKKGVAQKIVYGAFEIVQEKTGKEPLEVFEQAMENVMPSLEVKAPPCGRLHLSGAYGGPSRAAADSGPALAHLLFQKPF